MYLSIIQKSPRIVGAAACMNLQETYRVLRYADNSIKVFGIDIADVVCLSKGYALKMRLQPNSQC